MIRVGIVGATGYAGVELMRLLSAHDGVEIAAVTSRGGAGRRVDSEFPSLRGFYDGVFVAPDEDGLAACDVVFFATPTGTAMTQAPALLDRGVRVIDISTDFRLQDAQAWSQWHGATHACPDRLGEAVYGLPERHRGAVAESRLVGNPGCYPTAVELGFLPLIETGAVDGQRLIASATSGASGAGRNERQDLLLAEQADNTRAYAAGGHRHVAEMRQELEAAAKASLGITFVPHLVPQIRGIHATLYAELDREIDVQSLFEQRYRDEPFVDVMPAGSHPQTRSVRATNTCRLAIHRPPDEPRRVVVLSVIDNLAKGAAGQAIQNMNLMVGLDETAGLRGPAVSP
ncbi:MAG: N-acetyl-gamma-glutamyl-phosphate reductase [Proteobacteria bacterium SW_6_67_9]|nr:MAG: N-acetyl-gamma-glutamyl-phosphate reductase [Proteobacteria bacterium SW_6_67_9]